MRESASGSRTPQGSDAFSPTAQLADFADDESRWNNFMRVADVAARNALSAPEVRDGLLVETLDTHIVWQWFDAASTWRTVNSVACALSKSANQSLTTSAAALTWDVEVEDPFSMHDSSLSTRIYAPIAGTYEVLVTTYNSNTSGLGTMYARVNGATDVAGSLDRRSGDAVGALPLHSVFSLKMSAGDYIEIMVLHATATGNIAGGTTQGSAVLSMKRIC